jgi:hypothetical protein
MKRGGTQSSIIMGIVLAAMSSEPAIAGQKCIHVRPTVRGRAGSP